jgi:hypothetical protein
MDMSMEDVGNPRYWRDRHGPMVKEQQRLLVLDSHRLASEIKPKIHHSLCGFVMVSEDENFLTR